MRSYTFEEYKLMINDKESLLDKFISSLNQIEYKKLIILIALFMHKNSIVYCATTEAEISIMANQILHILMIFSKYGCMCMGVKAIIENALQGANFRQATTSGIQYFLIYILLTLYPKLFAMIKI